MAEVLQSLEQLGQVAKGVQPEAPVHVKKVDAQGRAYATGKRKNAIARVWIKPGSGKITVNTRDQEVYFARPVLRLILQQPLMLVDRMTHVKAALIDGEELLAGSSNFDFVSYRLNSEYVAIIRDKGLIAAVEEQLLAPLRAESSPPRDEEQRGWAPLKARLALQAADKVLRFLRPGRRVGEWRRP